MSHTKMSSATYPGLFFTLEGCDGCGKTTQAAELASLLRACNYEVVQVREPGGTAISEQIRHILLNPDNAAMAAEAELLLYEASRAQLVQEVIIPALRRGAAVVCDRYTDSTYAYQVSGRNLNKDMVLAANAMGSCNVVPTRTLVLSMNVEEAYKRALSGSRGSADRMEMAGLQFQQDVYRAYEELAHSEPERIRIIDAQGTKDEVCARIVDELSDLVPELKQAYTDRVAQAVSVQSGAAQASGAQGEASATCATHNSVAMQADGAGDGAAQVASGAQSETSATCAASAETTKASSALAGEVQEGAVQADTASLCAPSACTAQNGACS